MTAADSTYLNFETLVFSFTDRAPKVEEIDAAILKAKGTPAVNAVEFVVRPEFTNALLDVLLERGFRRIGSISNATTTWLRWSKRFDVADAVDEDRRIVLQRAGLMDW